MRYESGPSPAGGPPPSDFSTESNSNSHERDNGVQTSEPKTMKVSQVNPYPASQLRERAEERPRPSDGDLRDRKEQGRGHSRGEGRETGVTFDGFLPLPTRKPEPEHQHRAPLPTGEERILLVDDQEPNATVGKEILRYLQYDVTVRTDSLQALNTFREHPDRFDMVVTDLTMPNLSGFDLSLEVQRIRPGLPIILCTGFSKEITEDTLRHRGIHALLKKPYGLREIAETVRRVLDSNQPGASAGTLV